METLLRLNPFFSSVGTNFPVSFPSSRQLNFSTIIIVIHHHHRDSRCCGVVNVVCPCRYETRSSVTLDGGGGRCRRRRSGSPVTVHVHVIVFVVVFFFRSALRTVHYYSTITMTTSRVVPCWSFVVRSASSFLMVMTGQTADDDTRTIYCRRN